jgi:hypothetical protein
MFTRGRFNEEYLPGLFMLAIDSYENKRVASRWPTLVGATKTSKKSKEEDVIRSGLTTLRNKAEGAGVTYDTQIGGPTQTWVHTVRALAVRITEEAVDDNLYELSGGSEGSLKELFYDLGESAEETIETEMARFFNSCTATTYHTDRFGNALCKATQERLDGSTYSNYATSTDLTYSTFWANLIAAENQYNHRQHRIMKKVKTLWVPPQREQKGREVLQSTDRPDTANRAVSAYAKSGRNIELQVWRHMTDADSWIFQLEGRGIVFFWSRKTRFARDKDFATGDIMIKVDQRWSAEIADVQCFYLVVPA